MIVALIQRLIIWAIRGGPLDYDVDAELERIEACRKAML